MPGQKRIDFDSLRILAAHKSASRKSKGKSKPKNASLAKILAASKKKSVSKRIGNVEYIITARKTSGRKHSPKRLSPRRKSPRRHSPKRHSPKRHSPKRQSPKKVVIPQYTSPIVVKKDAVMAAIVASELPRAETKKILNAMETQRKSIRHNASVKDRTDAIQKAAILKAAATEKKVHFVNLPESERAKETAVINALNQEAREQVLVATEGASPSEKQKILQNIDTLARKSLAAIPEMEEVMQSAVEEQAEEAQSGGWGIYNAAAGVGNLAKKTAGFLTGGLLGW